MTYLNPILLAEDDDDDTMFFEQAVHEIHSDLQILRYRNGLELLEQIASVQQPGILFLDINMPKANGYQCLVNIRSDKRFQQLPIIIFSTAGSADLIQKLEEAGADAFIVKPNDYNLWKMIIEKTIETDWRNPAVKNANQFVLKIN